MDYGQPKTCTKLPVISNDDHEHSMVTDHGWSLQSLTTGNRTGHMMYRSRETRRRCECFRGKCCGRRVIYPNRGDRIEWRNT